jgi:hypothetical protein
MITPMSPGPLLVVMAADARSMRRVHAHVAERDRGLSCPKRRKRSTASPGPFSALLPRLSPPVLQLISRRSSPFLDPLLLLPDPYLLQISPSYGRPVHDGPCYPCDSPWRQLESRTACATCRGSSARRPLHEAAGGWLRTNRRSCIRRSGGCRSKLTNPSLSCGRDVMRMAQVARVCLKVTVSKMIRRLEESSHRLLRATLDPDSSSSSHLRCYFEEYAAHSGFIRGENRAGVLSDNSSRETLPPVLLLLRLASLSLPR